MNEDRDYTYGMFVIDSVERRENCQGCKKKNVPVKKITEEGLRMKRATAWVCVNPVCWRYVDLLKTKSWTR